MVQVYYVAGIQTSCYVGQSIVLPCTIPSPCNNSQYLQWLTSAETVFERLNDVKFEGKEFQTRVDVSQENVKNCNCSLIITDVHLEDAGYFESYLIIGERVKSKQLLAIVNLYVYSHKLEMIIQEGQSLTLNLHTSQAKQLVVQRSDLSQQQIWQHDKQSTFDRLYATNLFVNIRNITMNDQGIYQVLNIDGFIISTTKVTVVESSNPTIQAPHIESRSTNLKCHLFIIKMCLLSHFYIT